MLKGDLPLVSIVIPVYNGEKYIREAIESVLQQNYPNIELLVMDDGSQDNTVEIIKQFADRIYWETHANMGQANTQNKGWQLARGEVLAYLSADDALLPNAVSTSVRYLLSDKDVVLTYCDYYHMDRHSEIIRRVCTPEYDYMDMVVRIICTPGPGAFFRREGFEKTGLWDPSLRQTPDYDYWIRLGLQGRFLRIPEFLAKFRVHDESQSFFEPDEEKSEEILRIMHQYFEMGGIPGNVMAVKDKALGNANIVAARYHMRAGRHKTAANRLLQALRLNPACLFSIRNLKLLANGLSFRISRAIS
jgi:glycosyltransferase involved in cell wall biosynthesis